jgi:hypothetical protein
MLVDNNRGRSRISCRPKTSVLLLLLGSGTNGLQGRLVVHKQDDIIMFLLCLSCVPRDAELMADHRTDAKRNSFDN